MSTRAQSTEYVKRLLCCILTRATQELLLANRSYGWLYRGTTIYSCRERNNRNKVGLFLDLRYRTQGSTVRILSRIVQELAFDDGTREMSIYITLRGYASDKE